MRTKMWPNIYTNCLDPFSFTLPQQIKITELKVKWKALFVDQMSTSFLTFINDDIVAPSRITTKGRKAQTPVFWHTPKLSVYFKKHHLQWWKASWQLNIRLLSITNLLDHWISEYNACILARSLSLSLSLSLSEKQIHYLFQMSISSK